MSNTEPRTAVAEAPPAWLKDLLAALPQQQPMTPEALKAIVEGAGLNSAIAMRQSLRPENEMSAPNSVFHPLGTTKGTLRRETFVCHVKQNEDMLTPAEIDAFNAIEHDCAARNDRWTARIERNGTSERLFIDFPCKSVDDRMELPPIAMICRELAGGSAAVDVNALAAELAALKASLATEKAHEAR